MALSDEKIRGFMKRLLVSRMRILCDHGLFGMLLMHMIYALDEGTDTAYTDGERIAFSPEFLDGLSDRELDFVMMHEIMHVVLQHCLRGDREDPVLYNIAADIVVNSIIMEEKGGDPRSITLSNYGEAMHKAPDGKEGSLYTAEEVFEMLSSVPRGSRSKNKGGSGGAQNGNNGNSGSSAQNGNNGSLAGNGKKGSGGRGRSSNGGGWDDHSHWGETDDSGVMRDVWVKRFSEACEAISIRENWDVWNGTLPMFAKRMLEELTRPQTDWRRILSDFVQEEINDYSFSPPDRRFDDSPFFLPDFNEKDETVKDILFMVDTSGSMSDKEITAAFSEIKGAIEQFDGKLCGWLGFFDAAVVEPRPFSSFDELIAIRPKGGGGTGFDIIFDYVREHMIDEPPASIIILTDGFGDFPDEKAANGIPVLWLLNNEKVTPPWGKTARIKV